MEMAHCPGEGWEVNPGHTRTEGLNFCCFYFSVQGLFKEFTGIQPAVTAGPSQNYFQVSSPFSCHSMLFFVTLV